MNLKKFAVRGIVSLAVFVALCMFFSGTVRTITTPKVRLTSAKRGKLEERVELSCKVAFPEVDKGHYNMLDGLADIILEGADSPCDALAGSRATCMSLKARESARLGLPVKISRDEYDFLFDHD